MKTEGTILVAVLVTLQDLVTLWSRDAVRNYILVTNSSTYIYS